jgi:hypothetical protein
VSLGGGLPSTKGERSRLRPLLSFIVGKQRARERNPKKEEDEEKEKASWFLAWNGEGIYSPGGIALLQ